MKKITKELNQACAETYYNRGVAHSRNGELDKAIQNYTKAIELKPNYTEVYYQRGIAYRIKGGYERAIKDYTKVIELKPDYADAYYRRSRAWLHLGEKEKAKSDMTIASSMRINSKTALDEILRDYDRAWKTLGNISDT